MSTSIMKTKNICKIVNDMCTVKKYCFFLHFLVLALEIQRTLAWSVRKMVTWALIYVSLCIFTWSMQSQNSVFEKSPPDLNKKCLKIKTLKFSITSLRQNKQKTQRWKIWMSCDCTNCNCTDLKMIKIFFLFITCVYLHFNFTQCFHTKDSFEIQRDLGKIHTEKSKWKQTL